jgi:hypothetical protein
MEQVKDDWRRVLTYVETLFDDEAVGKVIRTVGAKWQLKRLC